VIHIHGGGWTQYGKHLEDCAFLAKAGFCTVSINYRYAQHARFPAQLEDAILALRWVRGHAAELGIDVNRVYVWGISAGGHLAALMGVQADLNLRGVGAICAPSDLTDQSAWQREYADPNGGFQTLLGDHWDAQPALAARASPARQVSSRAAPFLIVHGELDAHVPVSQALELHAALRAASVPATLRVIPDGDHFINESHRITIQTSLLEFFTALELEYISP
jgi:acetyl esterase/lipase